MLPSPRNRCVRTWFGIILMVYLANTIDENPPQRHRDAGKNAEKAKPEILKHGGNGGKTWRKRRIAGVVTMTERFRGLVKILPTLLYTPKKPPFPPCFSSIPSVFQDFWFWFCFCAVDPKPPPGITSKESKCVFLIPIRPPLVPWLCACVLVPVHPSGRY